MKKFVTIIKNLHYLLFPWLLILKFLIYMEKNELSNCSNWKIFSISQNVNSIKKVVHLFECKIKKIYRLTNSKHHPLIQDLGATTLYWKLSLVHIHVKQTSKAYNLQLQLSQRVRLNTQKIAFTSFLLRQNIY